MVMLLSLLMVSAVNSIAQNVPSNFITPFDKGIIIENNEVLIPWGIEASNLIKIGNPKIDTLTRRVLNVIWDSVTICGGVKGSIKYNPGKKMHGDNTKFFHLYALVDNADCERLVQYCNENIYATSKHKKWRGKFPQYNWRTSKIFVQINRGKYFTLMYIARDPADI